MALTGAQTQSVYLACGMWSEGGSRYRVRFDAYSTASITDSSITWDYSAVKTAITTRLAALSADANTMLGTFITVFDATITSSFRKEGAGDGVVLDDSDEFRKAKGAIVQMVGLEVEPVKFASDLNAQSICGRVTR